MPSGGARTGSPGAAYPNRADLRTQAVQVAPSTQYGRGARDRAAQESLPLPAVPAPGQNSPGLPTQRPDEPVTAGLPFGPGPGPAITAPAVGDPTAATIRELYRRSGGDPDLFALVIALERQGR